MSVKAIGDEMSWGEAWRQVEVLLSDPASHLAAAVAGWRYPVDRMTLVLMDLYDLQHQSKAKKKPKPYPRPWPETKSQTTAPAADVTQEQIIAALRFAGHTANLPGIYQPPPGPPRDARGRFVKVS